MKGYTHAAVGGCIGYVFARITGCSCFPALASSALGALAPDLDHPDAYLSRRIPLWRPIISAAQTLYPKSKTISHRGILHSIYGLAFFSAVALVAALLFFPKYLALAVAFSLGYFSHLYMADIFNASGVHLFSMRKSVRIPKVGRHLKVGGPGEMVFLSFSLSIPMVLHLTREIKVEPSLQTLFTNLPIIIAPLALVTLAAFLLVRLKARSKRARNMVTFSVELPRDDLSDLEVATNLFNTLHGIRYPWYRRVFAPQPHITVEIAGAKEIVFYVSVPNERDLPRRVMSIFQSLYPNILFTSERRIYIDPERPSAVCQIKQKRHPVFPIKSYLFDEETADPMSALTNSLAECPPGEVRVIQILIKPTGHNWQHKARRIRNRVREKGNLSVSTNSMLWLICDILEMIVGVVGDLLSPPSTNSRDPNDPRMLMSTAMIPEEIKEFDEGADRKLQRNCFRTEIRLIVQGERPEYHEVEALADAFGIYKGLNTLKRNRVWAYSRWLFLRFAKEMLYPLLGSRTILDAEELGSIYHPPGKQVETRGLRRTYQRSKETVVEVPTEGLFMGYSVDRNQGRKVALDPLTESTHATIFGRTGVGKTEFLKNLINEGLKDGGGMFLDPHGDAAKELCGQIDSDFCHKVIYWAPWSESIAIGFNVLEKSEDTTVNEINLITSNVVDVFHSSWQMKAEFVRLKHYLRYGLMTLLHYPEPMTILELEPLYLDKNFREKVLRKIKDREIRFFWHEEFERLDRRQKMDHLMSLLDRLSTISLDRRTRHSLGQNRSQIDFVDLMDSGKFLIVDLDMSKLGEENARLMGTLLISKVFQSSMSRKNREMKFRLFVDEAQNFMTESYSKILSQSRKFGIVQYLSCQYLEQLTEEVLTAVIGNVGTITAMRCGINDAKMLAPYFARNQVPDEVDKTIEDLINLDAYQALVKTTAFKKSIPSFKMRTPPMLRDGNVDEDQQHYITIKLNDYAFGRQKIDAMIDARRFQCETKPVGQQEEGSNVETIEREEDGNQPVKAFVEKHLDNAPGDNNGNGKDKVNDPNNRSVRVHKKDQRTGW